MNNSKAEQGICPYKTAEQHIQKMNPSMWDGKGRKPKTFDTRIVTYSIDDDTELDISFELDEEEWTHYVELRDRKTEALLNCLHGYGIDSIQNLADTIADICKGYFQKEQTEKT